MIHNHDKFGIGNFKGFQEVQEIEIAPITLIFGQNSGGKTSLLQSILALSQSFSKFKMVNLYFQDQKSMLVLLKQL